MYIDDFVGNQQIAWNLKRALNEGILPHALLFLAQRGLGANFLALLLACDITGADFATAKEGKSPAVMTIKGEGASGLIRVDAVRALTARVQYSSIESEKRAVVIENCENFNQSSANALLKSLEEPKSDITYILTANIPQRVMSTIRSRCSVYTLSEPSIEQVTQYFDAKGADMEMVSTLLSLYGANIGKIRDCLEDPDRFRILKSATEALNAAYKQDKYAFARACFSCASSRQKARMFLWDIRDISGNDLDDTKVRLIELSEKYEEYLGRNVNINLIFENFAAEMAQ